MKEYTVRVTETNAWNIKIQAEDEDQAVEFVANLYSDSINWSKERLDDVDMNIGDCDFEIV
ncbi:MAG: hypothetical protein IID51_09775 [Proteobacteria bacterium]|nr:hypothetical protein [Pseudomonadota bacterium]